MKLQAKVADRASRRKTPPEPACATRCRSEGATNCSARNCLPRRRKRRRRRRRTGGGGGGEEEEEKRRRRRGGEEEEKDKDEEEEEEEMTMIVIMIMMTMTKIMIMIIIMKKRKKKQEEKQWEHCQSNFTWTQNVILIDKISNKNSAEYAASFWNIKWSMPNNKILGG